jgi:hypothetical protein
MTLQADELTDMRLNEDREIEVGGDNDWRTTSGVGTIKQSVGISAGGVLSELIGEPVTPETFEDVQEEVQKVLSRDPQIANVRRVKITEVNVTDNTVSMQVFVDNNNDFEITVPT